MAKQCDVCGKKTQHGNQQIHKHSKKWKFRAPKTKRTWEPNLRPVKVEGKGKQVKIKMCMSCYKKYTVEGASFLKSKEVKELKGLTLV